MRFLPFGWKSDSASARKALNRETSAASNAGLHPDTRGPRRGRFHSLSCSMTPGAHGSKATSEAARDQARAPEKWGVEANRWLLGHLTPSLARSWEAASQTKNLRLRGGPRAKSRKTLPLGARGGPKF